MLTDDGGYIARRCDIESGILDSDIFGRHVNPEHVGDFARRPLLDWYLIAGSERQVEGGDRRRHVKRYAILFRQHRHRISSDLVRDVAIRGDAVRSHHYAANPTGAQEMTRHVVGNESGGYAVLLQFPGGQPRTLQNG